MVALLSRVIRWRFSETTRPAKRPALTNQTVALREFFCKVVLQFQQGLSTMPLAYFKSPNVVARALLLVSV